MASRGLRTVLLPAFVAMACHPHEDPLADAKHISGWANSSSALGVFTYGYDPLAIADGMNVPADPACPTLTDDGTTLTITGDDCLDGDGTQWNGSTTVVRDASGGRDVSLRGFDKAEDPSLSAPVTGSFVVAALGPDRHSFRVDVMVDGGIENHTVYEGTVAGGYVGPTVWNGSGTIEREGLVINSGTVDATTVDELRDGDVCPGEGISGTTTMVSDEHTVVITYDGESDCDPDDAARWSKDGVEQGLVKGVTCAVFGGGDPRSALLPVALALVILPWGRRRRSARP